MIWLVFNTIVWGATLFAAVIVVRVATLLVWIWRPAGAGESRRDGRWLFAWVVLLAAACAVVRCEAGGFHGFSDPAGGDWEFDGHGWPLTVPREALASSRSSSALQAICWMAVIVDLLTGLLLVGSVRLMVDRLLAAWDEPRRWPALAREALGWFAGLGLVLFCERWAARPIMLPGTELIVYTTLIYEIPEVRAGILLSLAAAVYLSGRNLLRGWRTLKRLHDEGVL